MFCAKEYFHETLWTILSGVVYNESIYIKGRMIPMLKKFAALTLSLLLCLSLLPSHVLAASVPEPDDPVTQVDPLDPDEPDDADPVMAASAVSVPEKGISDDPVH